MDYLTTATYMFVPHEEEESIVDLLFWYTPSDIQEVSWFSPMELDDVHGSHGKTSTIHCEKTCKHITVLKTEFRQRFQTEILLLTFVHAQKAENQDG